MKRNMITYKGGIPFGYLVSASTSAAGSASIAKEQIQVEGIEHVVQMHSYFGFALSEWALMIGIAGTIGTMIFQYLNYRNNKKKL
jgi:hypothetical protein